MKLQLIALNIKDYEHFEGGGALCIKTHFFSLINFKLCSVLQWFEETCGQLGQEILCCQGRSRARLYGRILSL